MSNRKRLLAIAYLASIVFVVVNSIVVLLGPYPAFFTATGPTLLRQVVLGSAVFLFVVASIVFGFQYSKSKSPSLFWYTFAIALLSIGLFSAFEVKVLGDVPTWLGRVTLYAGTSYLVAAILASRQKSVAGSDLADSWADTFRSDRGQISTLFSNMLDAFVYGKTVVDENGKPIDTVFLEVNNAFEKITGIKKESVIGKKASEIVPGVENDPAGWIGIYGRVAITGESVQFDNFLEPLKKWYHVSAYSPKKGYFVSIFEDITERKKAEKEIVDLAKFPLENPAVVLRVDQKGVIMFANPAAHVFLEERHTKVGELVPEDVRQRVADALASGVKIEFEANLAEETFSFLVAPIVAEGYANIYGRNVTKRKKAEEKLRESRIWEATSFYTRNLIEASLDPLVTISAEGKITDVNKATEQVTGCSREELIGSDFSNYFTEPEKAAAGYKHVFTEGTVRDYPLAIKHKSGKITDVLYNASLYRNAEGQVQGVFAAARDITDRKNLEKQLQEKERLATIGATAGMVGHDIRNPLQAITSDVYLAKTELASIPDSEERKNVLESLEEIENNIFYINKIVDDLQDYARPLKPVARDINLYKLVDELLAKNSVPKNINVQVKVPEESSVVADPDLLKRVLGNLVTNAVQAMPEGGKLSIKAYKDADDVVITVADTGVGIPEEIKEKLFTPLFTTKSKGQGFGLAVVKRVTESMNSTVSVDSEVGKGTKFTIRLPTQRIEQ